MARPQLIDRTFPWSWLLTSPVFVGSVLLLAVNDHILKGQYPGWVTGKLSDVAGVAMVAMALTALIGRPRAACVLSASAFVALKTFEAVAEAAVPILGGRTLTDVSDLIALPALIPLVVWMRHHNSTRGEASPRRHLPLKVIALGAAALATSATSCDEVGIQRVRVDGAQILAVDGDGSIFASPDGTTWTEQDSNDPPPFDATATPRRSCAGGVCFEIIERSIERRENAATTVDFELSAADVEAMVERFSDGCSSTGDLLGTIAVIDTPGGIVAVASMGELGVLTRSGSGVWSLTDVGDNVAGTRSSGGGWAPALAFGLILLLAIVSIPIGFLARRANRSVVGYVLGTLGAALALFLAASVLLLFESFATRIGYLVELWIPVQVIAIGFGALMIFLAGRSQPTPSTQTPPYPPGPFNPQATQPPPPTPADRRD